MNNTEITAKDWRRFALARKYEWTASKITVVRAIAINWWMNDTIIVTKPMQQYTEKHGKHQNTQETIPNNTASIS